MDKTSYRIRPKTPSHPPHQARHAIHQKSCVPNVPLLGDGLTYASGFRDNSVIRVLSPRIEPPVLVEDGSTALLATESGFAMYKFMDKIPSNLLSHLEFSPSLEITTSSARSAASISSQNLNSPAPPPCAPYPPKPCQISR